MPNRFFLLLEHFNALAQSSSVLFAVVVVVVFGLKNPSRSHRENTHQQQSAMITHVVFFKFTNPEAEKLIEAKELIMSMVGKVAVLKHLEAGAGLVHSARSYDLCLISKFANMDDLQAYQEHPYHKGTVSPFMKAASSSIVAVDFESS